MTGPSAILEVSVWFDGYVGVGPVIEPVVLAVAGPAHEPFEISLARAAGSPPEYHSFSLVRLREGEATREWLGQITSQVTMEDASRFADGDLLHVDMLGRGGGPIPLMWDLVQAGLRVTSLGKGMTAFAGAIDAARQRPKRTAAKNWLDAGTDTEPSMQLQQFVYEESSWRRKDFDRTFDLDKRSGPELLRHLGYRKTHHLPEIWTETAPE